MAPPKNPNCRKIATPTNHPSPSSSTVTQSKPETATTRQLKKRELDRRAQRLSRERTKSRIANLERLVEDFQGKETDGQVKALAKSLQTVTKERDAALALLRNLGFSISHHLSTSQDVTTTDSTMGPCDPKPRGTVLDNPTETPMDNLVDSVGSQLTDRTDGIMPAQIASPEPACSLQELGFSPASHSPPDAVLSLTDDPMDDLFSDLCQPENIFDSVQPADVDLISPAPMPGCGCHPSSRALGSSESLNLWRFANEVLTPSHELGRDDADFDEEWQDDLPVRAVVDGWPSIEAKLGRLPSLWRKLRPIDDVVFHGCGKAERIAMLKLMHDLLLYHSEPSTERRAKIQPWYLERPSQAISHSYAINFFAWPGIRERFVFYQHTYCGNIFWRLFSSSLRLLWPYEFRDTYSLNVETGHYNISDAFKQRVDDINAWTMTEQIFEQWPEFYSDIPAFARLPRSLTFKTTVPPNADADPKPKEGQHAQLNSYREASEIVPLLT
ncbi:hypothetical protein B0J13DRAFT_676429 [Dactylonectria estremocensis]|uniref:BZIP transcription factor n=1 Tax=Dactylonectria estremocensis TaxID=1079267 RepID=A0A9P9EL38_9HYPO|nr:hypothetical protein B0J13DRAFT_676429 [Dactylonectria estremocensis]